MTITLLSEKILCNLPEFDHHAAVYAIYDKHTELHGFIAIHKQQGSYPSLGATRLWQYDSLQEALRDALRLSRLMTFKSALAGLPYGGAKAVLMKTPGADASREAFFRAYAAAINQIQGQFITGTDVGLTPEDLSIMTRNSKYVIGHHVNAGYCTALGIFLGIQSALQQLYGSDIITGRSFAIQGLGKTGGELLRLLIERGASRVYVADIDEARLRLATSLSPTVVAAPPERIHSQMVDVFSPCALSGAINEKTVVELRCKAVIGSANNQLATPEMGTKLYQAGILYAPDYVVNAGGFISVVDQYVHGAYSEERVMAQLLELQQRLTYIFRGSVLSHQPTVRVAELAVTAV